MQTTYPRKKYTSFILSCLLHALILFLILYTHVQQSVDSLFPMKKQPAQIQVQTSSAQAAQKPVSQAQQALPLHPTNIDTPQSVDQQEQRPQALSQNTPEPIPEESIQTPPILEQQKAQQAVPMPQERKESAEQAPPRDISPSAFMSAFKSAVRAERREARATDESHGPDHVQARLKEWSQHHYKQRIIEALRQASKLSTRTMNHDKSIDMMAHITIPIHKNGSLGDMTKYSLSGIPEVDRYIINIIRSADFPPIPDRYKTDRFVFRVPIRIKLKRGTTTYNLFVS